MFSLLNSRASRIILPSLILALASCSGGIGDAPGTVTPGASSWHVQTLDSTGNVGQGASLRLIAGMPAISYADDSNFGCRFIRALDASGTNWSNPVQVATGAFTVSDSTSLELIGGNPAIAFQRGNVKYARATDPIGTAWSAFVPVSSTNTRDSINLLMLGDRPVVISRDPDIEISRANDPVGTSWPTTSIKIDGSNRPVSAALVGGRAAIAYTTGTDQLVYRRAANEEATLWDPPIVVDDEQFSNSQPSLSVVAGMPAISYINGSDLLYVRADDANGVSWSSPAKLLSSEGSATGQTDLAVIAALPAIAFSKFAGADRQLWYVTAKDVDGTQWKAAQKVDSTGNVGASLSLGDVNGRPGIAYYDATGANLKYAILQ